MFTLKTKRPRKENYTLERYLEKMNKKKILTDQEVQRLKDNWNQEMKDDLICTGLTNGYIPPIILAEVIAGVGTFNTYILDGLQRSSTLQDFRYGNKKIKKNVSVEYQCVETDESGNQKNVLKEFNLKGKTYDDLPEELKDMFNDYQIETVIHENLTMEEASEYVKIYNNHQAMSKNQKAFTHQGNFARKIREIINKTHFFDDCGGYTSKNITDGSTENMISESYNAVFDLDKWIKDPIERAKHINENGDMDKFNKLMDLFNELFPICEGKYKNLLNTKNTCVFVALFNEFKKYNLGVDNFSKFLDALEDELLNVECGVSIKNKEVECKTWAEINKNTNTKDSSTIKGKIKFLTTLMKNYLHIEENLEEDREEYNEEDEVLSFLKENISTQISNEDVDYYERDLKELKAKVKELKIQTKIFDYENCISLLGIIAYGYKHDIIIDEWLLDYCEHNNLYIKDQVKNLEKMIKALNDYASAHAA